MTNQDRPHILQLDGLRALAVFAVLIAHFFPREHLVYRSVPWGELGVHLFFVLSGFLITSILLRCREAVEKGSRSTPGVLASFYVRRFLRIFPLYYVTLIILAACNYGDIRASFAWHFGYLSNVYFVLTNSGHGRIAHFWTLAVEEQFYLVWPWLMLFLPRRLLMPLTLSAVLAGPLFRLAACLMWPENYIARIWLPFACLDTLGMGAFLALVSEASSRYARWKGPAVLCGLLVGGPLLTICLAGYALGRLPRGVDAVMLRTVMACFFFWLTAKTAIGFKGWFGRGCLGSRPLVYVGKISYGIYVIHFFVPQLTAWVFARVGLWYPSESLLLQFVLHCAVTMLLASAAWHLFERYLNNLKRFFPYESDPGRAAAPIHSRASAAKASAQGVPAVAPVSVGELQA